MGTQTIQSPWAISVHLSLGCRGGPSLFPPMSPGLPLNLSLWHWIYIRARSLSHVWLCDPVDWSLPGSSGHGTLCSLLFNGYRSFSLGRWKGSRDRWWWCLHSNVCSMYMLAQSCPTLCDHMDVAPRAPLSMGFPGQEYWSGLPFPPPGDLPHPGIEPVSLTSSTLAGIFFITEPPGKPTQYTCT